MGLGGKAARCCFFRPPALFPWLPSYPLRPGCCMARKRSSCQRLTEIPMALSAIPAAHAPALQAHASTPTSREQRVTAAKTVREEVGWQGKGSVRQARESHKNRVAPLVARRIPSFTNTEEQRRAGTGDGRVRLGLGWQPAAVDHPVLRTPERRSDKHRQRAPPTAVDQLKATCPICLAVSAASRPRDVTMCGPLIRMHRRPPTPQPTRGRLMCEDRLAHPWHSTD